MQLISRILIALYLIATANAGAIHVTVGNTGCRTKQLTVQRLWKSIPGVRSVAIIPRKMGDPANQRVFVITTHGADPDQAVLARALGDRIARYPILSLAPAPPSTR